MSEEPGGRPCELTCEEVLAGFEAVDKPVATAGVWVDAPKRAVLRRLREVTDEERMERWKVGGRAVVWWPCERS